MSSTSDDPIGIALIGPGVIAQYHLEGLAATQRAVLKVIVGRDLSRTEQAARQFEAESASTDLDAALCRADIAAIIVTTPDDTHEAIACAAARAGKAILVQKPMATNSTACERIIEAAASAKVDLQVSFMHRYFEEVQAAKTLIESGAIGDVTSARIRNATPGPDWGGWFFDSDKVGTGVVAQLGVHGIDLLQYLLGPIAAVSARLSTLVPRRRLRDGQYVNVMNPDTAIASYRLENGILASHEMSMLEVAGCDRFRLELYGTKGTLWLRTERGALAIANEEGTWSTPPLESVAFGRRQHDRWLDGLVGKEAPETTAVEALAGMQVLEAIERSSKQRSAEVDVVRQAAISE